DMGKILAQEPSLYSFGMNIGANGSVNQAGTLMDMVPRGARNISVDQLIAKLRPELAAVPGLRIVLVNPPPINLGGSQYVRSLYQFSLKSTETAELSKWAAVFEEKMRAMPSLEDVTSDLLIKNPQVNLDLDRDKIATLGLNPTQVENALFSAYGARQVSQIY